MIRRAATALPTALFAAPLVLLLPAATPVAHRNYTVSSFERIRVAGPFDVRLTTGGAPSARAEADEDTLDRLLVSVDGTTLSVRAQIPNVGEVPRTPRVAPIIWLTTPMLRSAVVTGGGKLGITGMKTQRADLSVNGAGTLSVTGAATDQLNAIVIGAGSMSLAGRAQRAALVSNGTATIAAGGLDVNDLIVRLDGPGATQAAARFSATVTNIGLGQVSIAGHPSCRITAPAGGPVVCGTPK